MWVLCRLFRRFEDFCFVGREIRGGPTVGGVSVIGPRLGAVVGVLLVISRDFVGGFVKMWYNAVVLPAMGWGWVWCGGLDY